MIEEIGTTAGKVWTALSENDGATIAQLKKKVGGSPDLLQQALGWLAREDKIRVEKKGTSVRVFLK